MDCGVTLQTEEQSKQGEGVAVFSFCQRTQKHVTQFAECRMDENTLMACGGGR